MKPMLVQSIQVLGRPKTPAAPHTYRLQVMPPRSCLQVMSTQTCLRMSPPRWQHCFMDSGLVAFPQWWVGQLHLGRGGSHQTLAHPTTQCLQPPLPPVFPPPPPVILLQPPAFPPQPPAFPPSPKAPRTTPLKWHCNFSIYPVFCCTWFLLDFLSSLYLSWSPLKRYTMWFYPARSWAQKIVVLMNWMQYQWIVVSCCLQSKYQIIRISQVKLCFAYKNIKSPIGCEC